MTQQGRKQNVLLISRNSGTAFWRVVQPLRYIKAHGFANVTWLEPDLVPMRDRQFLDMFDTIVLHQIWHDGIVPLVTYWKQQGRNIVASVDDLIVGHDIPGFIKGGVPYRDPGVMRNVHDIMTLADKVVVTQPFLADSLAKFYEVQRGKFALFPNLPSAQWIGRYFRHQSKRRAVWRVGVMSSLSHYELGGGGAGGQHDAKPNDDFQILVDAAEEIHGTRLEGRIQWVLPVNGDKTTIDRLSRFSKNIESVNQTLIADFPQGMSNWNLDLSVAPLVKNDFNDSKSNIKVLEAAAMGFPLIASSSFAYDSFLEPGMMFADGHELAKRLNEVTSWTSDKHLQYVGDMYRKFYISRSDYYGIPLEGYFLERNPELVGDTFLDFSPHKDGAGIVPPSISNPKTVQEGKSDGQ